MHYFRIRLETGLHLVREDTIHRLDHDIEYLFAAENREHAAILARQHICERASQSHPRNSLANVEDISEWLDSYTPTGSLLTIIRAIQNGKELLETINVTGIVIQRPQGGGDTITVHLRELERARVLIEPIDIAEEQANWLNDPTPVTAHSFAIEAQMLF